MRFLPVPALVLLLAASAGSTILIRKDLAELSRESEAVVLARVLSTRCAWNAAHTLIWTANDLLVGEVWKGEVPRQLVVCEPGGLVPPVGQHVPGMARYAPGEWVVVFLRRDLLGQWRTHGCCQGRIRVVPFADGVWRPVVEEGNRHLLAAPSSRDQGHATSSLSLRELRQAIERLAGQGGEGR